jgi:hypothetical protein
MMFADAMAYVTSHRLHIPYEIYSATGGKIILLPKKNDGGTEA